MSNFEIKNINIQGSTAYSLWLAFLHSTSLLYILLFTACNSSLGDISKSNSSVNENLIFLGIDSVDGITDSTATLRWSHVTGSTVYQVFQVTDSSPIYIASVEAPGESYSLTGLSAAREYSYIVRAFDSEGLHDNNTKKALFTTANAPTAPSSLSLSNPTISPGFDDTPTILISGVKNGDTVNLFSDSSCSTLVGTSVASGSAVELTTNILTPAVYTFYAQTNGENPSNCSTANVTYEYAICPTGYVSVPANPVVGVNSNFCVMKYEAKAWNDTNSNGIIDAGEVDSDGCGEGACTTGNWATIPTYKPVSQEANLPWRRISQDPARNACNSLNASGETNYALISNPEWMALVRNIEAQNANWSGGLVGNGLLLQGNNGLNTVSSYDGSDPESGSGRDLKAMHVLSNGEEIWDISGNVWEWVDWNVTPANKAYSSVDGGPVTAWRELTVLDRLIGTTDEMFVQSWQPANTNFNSSQGVGQYFARSSSGGAAVRGAASSNGIEAGVFSLDLFNVFTNTDINIGFRCVYRP